jgi:hypothetical protein
LKKIYFFLFIFFISCTSDETVLLTMDDYLANSDSDGKGGTDGGYENSSDDTGVSDGGSSDPYDTNSSDPYDTNSTDSSTLEDTGEEERLSPPSFSHEPGFYNSSIQVSLSNTEVEGSIRIIYTLDGSTPEPSNLSGTSFEFKNHYPGGSRERASFISLEYIDPITIENRTDEIESMASIASDYNGYRIRSSDSRLFKGTVIRAMAVRDDGLTSPEVTRSYFVTSQGRSRYSLPVMSIAVTSKHFYDYEEGIYTPGKIWDDQAGGVKDGGAIANYAQRGDEWEKYAHLEFFDGGSTGAALSQNVGLRIHGGYSRAHAMKSLRIYARNSYGEEYLNHRIFPQLPHDKYKRLILRNSGNDWDFTFFRDAAIAAVMSPLQVDLQAYRPVILFINGEYWGIHNIRERYDKHYLARTFGVPDTSVDLMTVSNEHQYEVKEGNDVHFQAMLNYISQHDLSQATHYEYIKTRMDTDNFIDFQIAHIYSRNTDWPGNNVDFWRHITPFYNPDAQYGHDGRWRWMVFDTDFGFGIWNNNYLHNTLSFAASSSGPDWPNPPWSTFLLRNLLNSNEFRDQFINRFADLLNTAFLPSRAVVIINDLQRAIEPEMGEHISRWSNPESISYWQEEVDKMIEFVNERPANQRSHINSHFGLSGTYNLNVDVSDSSRGYLRVNTIDVVSATEGVSSNVYPWSGEYFAGVPIEIEAVPNPGSSFSHWEGVSATNSVIRQSFSDDVTIVAHFR